MKDLPWSENQSQKLKQVKKNGTSIPTVESNTTTTTKTFDFLQIKDPDQINIIIRQQIFA